MSNYPCHDKDKSQWCDHLGPGGFMGHTCEVTNPVNMELTQDKIKRLVILIEECGEVIQAATKVLRFGFDSTHPLHPESSPSNLECLVQEIEDFKVIAETLDLDPTMMMEARSYKMEKLVNLGVFTHEEIYK